MELVWGATIDQPLAQRAGNGDREPDGALGGRLEREHDSVGREQLA